eukprot:m.213132 g.213132  ORF g.213132 m.213132 type:complete len:463 (+) comp15080_c1_seq2:129-1517(+)
MIRSITLALLIIFEAVALVSSEECTTSSAFRAASIGVTDLQACSQQVLEATDPAGCTPLLVAAWNGNLDALKQIHFQGSNAHLKCASGINAVQIAQALGNDDVEKHLKHAGVRGDKLELKPCSKNDWFEAAKTSDYETAERCLLTGTSIDVKDHVGCPALVAAVFNAHRDFAWFLVLRGATIDLGCSNGGTALMHAAGRGNMAIIELLLEYGANTETETSKDGWTALSYAAHSGHFDVALFLHKLELKTHTGWQGGPLMFAAAQGHVEMVKTLLKSGKRRHKNIEERDEHGQTPAIWAAQYGHLPCLVELKQAGADLEAETHSGWTALMGAVFNGHEGVVEFLLHQGVDLNKRDKAGFSALMWGIASNKRTIVDRLFKEGADASPAPGGWHPIHVAASLGYREMVQLLIHNGQDFDFKLADGRNCEQLARQNGHTGLADHLEHMAASRSHFLRQNGPRHTEL